MLQNRHRTKRIWYQTSLFLLSILIVLLLAIRVSQTNLPFIDDWSSAIVQEIEEHHFLYILFRWITELGSIPFMSVVIGMVSVLLWVKWKDGAAAFFLIIGVSSGFLLNVMVKSIVERERPRILAAIDAEGYSFPSGHAMVSLICYGLLTYLFMRYIHSKSANRFIIAVSSIFVLLIGFSRVMIRAHYVTDVVAGFILGYVWLLVVIFFHQLWIQIRNQKKKSD
ncbi:undecaprenyl-diphosphatase [Salirhabdus euzebyi]|uniref:Undecaprenyl-diphosphatase n=1 Tax=Salirhabdus euzebyi TaxID=394506 RepID=A0A841Q8N5_9BACI|nr:phosphatase PAP2 family protein [Salirhabdus euzebyi]MBB6454683.1 undecaprenyl-diphosphatase [Salirhabdus euzebyi]